MVPERIHRLIDAAGLEQAHFPPTLVYNEGWLLRLILDWCSRHELPEHPLKFQPGAAWFSEALLPTAFRARKRGDPRAEARTHADGLLGHIAVGEGAKADATLRPNATQLVCLEAKIFSPLSGGTRNAPGFSQAARSVACMAELLNLSGRRPSVMTSLAFFVLAPDKQIKTGDLAEQLGKPTIRLAVQKRLEDFERELDGWLERWFLPTLEVICIEALSWESLIGLTASGDPAEHQSLTEFYEHCLRHNQRGQNAESA